MTWQPHVHQQQNQDGPFGSAAQEPDADHYFPNRQQRDERVDQRTGQEIERVSNKRFDETGTRL